MPVFYEIMGTAYASYVATTDQIVYQHFMDSWRSSPEKQKEEAQFASGVNLREALLTYVSNGNQQGTCEQRYSQCIRQADAKRDQCIKFSLAGYGLGFGLVESACALTGPGAAAECALSVSAIAEITLGTMLASCVAGQTTDLNSCDAQRNQCYASRN